MPWEGEPGHEASNLAVGVPVGRVHVRECVAGVELESFVISPTLPSPNASSSVGPQGAPGPEAGPGATVAWPVTINAALLETLPATVQVNFPERPSVSLARLRHERHGSALFWSGQGGDCSGMFRIASDGGFKGTVSCLSAAYGIDTPRARRTCG